MAELAKAFPIELAELRASPKQKAFQKAFFARRDPNGRKVDVFFAFGANRSGKTVATGPLCFAKFLRDNARDGDAFWCVAPTFDKSVGSAGGQQKEIWNALPRWMFADQHWDEKIGFGMHRKVTLPTTDGGFCVVEFLSADQDAPRFETGRLRGIWADERLPESVYNRLLARIIDHDGFILYSDIPEQWWHFERLISAKPEAGVLCQHFEMRDNAANLPAGAIEQAAGRMTADEQKLRILGLMVMMQGLVYKEFDPRPRPTGRHVMSPFKIPDYWPRWRLIDYGSSAPTACLWVALSEDEIAYVYREHYDAGHSIPYNAVAILNASLGETYRETLMDPTCIATPPAIYGMSPSVAKQYDTAGIKANGWPWINVMGEHACVQRVKYRLERDTLRVFSTCVNTIREFSSWKYKCDRDGKPLAVDAYENDNNHTLDCVKGWLASNPTYTAPKIQVAKNE